MVGGARRRCALAALGWLIASSALADDRHTVAVDLTTLDPTSYEELDGVSLERSSVVRLVQDGFAVVSPVEHPDVLLSVRRSRGSLLVEARGPRGLTSRSVALSERAIPEVHLETVQKLSELARAAVESPEPEPEPEPRRAERQRAPAADPAPAPTTAHAPRAPARFEIGLGAGALYRGEIDPAAWAHFRAAAAGPIGVDVALGYALSPGRELVVHEWVAQVGAGYRLVRGGMVELDLGLLVGALVHAFWLDDPAASAPSGVRLDLALSVPVLAVFWPARHLGVALRIAPGLSEEGRRHTWSNDVLWERSALRLEAGIGALARW